MKGWTLTELLIMLCILGLLASLIFYAAGPESWLNTPIKDLTIKDVIILKFLFD